MTPDVAKLLEERVGAGWPELAHATAILERLAAEVDEAAEAAWAAEIA